MKYGDTLQQRSIPEWGNYNVDYNEIKRLIKEKTTTLQSKAISIPGQKDAPAELQGFDQELYAELVDQHRRVDLFVQSKHGEIQSRLDHLEKQAARLSPKSRLAHQKRVSVKLLEKVSKVEGDVLKTGEELQSLCRFVGAQRQAFKKLLKKYKKWTGAAELGERFHKQVLDRPESFAQRDFEPLLLQWADVLSAVRAPFDAGVSWKAEPDGQVQLQLSAKVVDSPQASEDPPSQRNTSNIADLHAISEHGSDVEVDTALATRPLGHQGGLAVYWVHVDILVELHVLVLQYMKFRTKSGPTRLSRASSVVTSRRPSFHGSSHGNFPERLKNSGLIVCDDLQSYALRRSGKTIGDMEHRAGRVIEEAVASIRYAAGREAVAAVRISPPDISKGLEPQPTEILTAELKRKFIYQIIDPSSPAALSRTQSNLSSHEALTQSEVSSSEALETVRQWFKDHPEIKPLIQLEYLRTRFVGLKNDETHGIWASLDMDITISKPSTGSYPSSPVSKDNAQEQFPHAVLEVRWEGQAEPELVTALEKSHLTERVRGFSLESHAIATLCNPVGMSMPFWIPALKNDIRKIPAGTSNPRPSKISKLVTPELVNPNRNSSSSTSVEGNISSGFSAVAAESLTSAPNSAEATPLKASKKKHRSRKAHPLRSQLDNPTTVRYWNEFDDGASDRSDQRYTILVDPDATISFPGSAAMESLAATFNKNATLFSEKARNWFQPSRNKGNGDQQPLTTDVFAQHPAAVESDVDSDDSSTDMAQEPRRYSTFSHPVPMRRALRTSVERYRESLLFYCCIGSYLASFALLAMAGMLEATRRKRYMLTANIGSLAGVVLSVMFALLGIGVMVARKDNVGWFHRAAVVLVSAIAAVGNAVLILTLIGN